MAVGKGWRVLCWPLPELFRQLGHVFGQAGEINLKARAMGTDHSRRRGSRSLTATVRRSAVVAVLFAGIALVGASVPADAQVAPGSTQATLLVGGVPLLTANCPTSPPAREAAGTSANGTAIASGVAACGNAAAAEAQGLFSVIGVAAGNLPFLAGCQASNLNNGGSVDVPAGTTVPAGTIPGFPAATTTTTVTTITNTNVPVTFPNGSTAIVNQVILVAGVSVTRNAVAFPNGTIVGQVICGLAAAYPLAVDVSSGSGATPAVATHSESGGSGHSTTTMLLIGGAFGFALLVQLAVGRRMRGRRGNVTD